MDSWVTVSDLVGGWRLVGWQITYLDGRVTRPFGPVPVGLLVYSPDGWMSAAISVPGRTVLDGADVRRAPLTQQAEAFATYFSYSGRFEVADGVITHHVEVALNPAFVGTRQVRQIELNGVNLVLSAREFGSSGARRHALSWRRADRSAA